MGILDRFATIVRANINELLDKAEDPAKMVDQYLVDLTESLAEVKRETAGVMAEEARTRRAVDRNAEESARRSPPATRTTPASSWARSRRSTPRAQSSQRPPRPPTPTPRRCVRCTTSS